MSQPTNICASCGFRNRRVAKFCGDCGARVEAAPAPVEAAPPPSIPVVERRPEPPAGGGRAAWVLAAVAAGAVVVIAAYKFLPQQVADLSALRSSKPAPGRSAEPKKPQPAAAPVKAVGGAGARAGMVHVPAGAFWMGSPEGEGGAEERPRRMVHLDAYYIDTYEVTAEEYGACVGAGGCLPPGTGTYCNWRQPGRGRHPVNCVHWHQAKAYCEWAGKRLPTEAEWEKAARGPDGRMYPWGNEPATCEYAVMEDRRDGCGEDRTWVVGSRPAGASPYGAMDMAGNVWEWVADWYDDGYYGRGPERDPRGPSSGKHRAVRGGSWNAVGDLCRSAYRTRLHPGLRYSFQGFRCAADRGLSRGNAASGRRLGAASAEAAP